MCNLLASNNLTTINSLKEGVNSNTQRIVEGGMPLLLSVIIPTYNEAQNIADLLGRLGTTLKNTSYEIIVVDDSSNDGTYCIVECARVEYPIRSIQRPAKKGLASAVLEGIGIANGELICVVDADCSHPVLCIPAMIGCLQKHDNDVVIASRYMGKGAVSEETMLKKSVSCLGTLIVKPLTRSTDPLSGFFIAKKCLFHKLTLRPRGYKVLLEIIARYPQIKTADFPYTFKRRSRGKSKITAQIYVVFLWQVLCLYFYRVNLRFIKTMSAFKTYRRGSAQ